jgi:FlaA1/EpsC-like NDP-sugar epimerase
MKPFEGKRLLITGGTGSLGKVLVRRLLKGAEGEPEKIIVFSRDEAKQHSMRMQYLQLASATDEVIFRNSLRKLEFRIGDIRDASAVASVLQGVDIVFNAAALKQVPTCEYFPYEAVCTNISGPENIVRAIQHHRLPVKTVIGISTDKACKPVNAMGMTKALQERVFIQANMRCPDTRFLCVRYGNVLASRGSVIPLFHEQIRHGGPITITTPDMTRFLLSLDDAVDTVFAAVRSGLPGDTFIPRVPSAKITDVASVLIAHRPIEVKVIGIRPGEKVHEILISDEESYRTVENGAYYVIRSMLPELCGGVDGPRTLTREFSSADSVMPLKDVANMLRIRSLMFEDIQHETEEVLR